MDTRPGCPLFAAHRNHHKELGIFAETVKTHVKRIRGKLGVSSRREAATKAQELGLIQE